MVSHRVGREMGVVVYGHYGLPVLAFPTSGGAEWELENMGLIPALAPYVDAGRVKIFTVGSNSDASWYNTGAHPFHRSWMQRMFDEYIRWEVIPFIHAAARGGLLPIATMGASLGAFHAANTLFKHPDAVKRCWAMSGVYDMRRFMDGMSDDNFYFNNPIDYLGGISDWGTDRPAEHVRHPHRHRQRPLGEAGALLSPVTRAREQGNPSPPGRLGRIRAGMTGRTGNTRCGTTCARCDAAVLTHVIPGRKPSGGGVLDDRTVGRASESR